MILQLLGEGTYDYDGTTGTASSSATTLGEGTLTYSEGIYTWTLASNASADALIVGGGGSGGGGDYGGAGGGGGGGTVETISSYSVAANTNYTIIVGAGGSAVNLSSNGNNGQSSSVFGTTALGGGGGGRKNTSGLTSGTTGGTGSTSIAGGGQGANSNASGSNGGAGVQSDITGITYYWGAGGGGAELGLKPDGTRAGNGGLGGGGGGASSGGAPGIGAGTIGLGDNSGINSGNNGSGNSTDHDAGCACPGGAGGANTGGGGGGGAGRGGGGAGGSGIVVMNYQVANPTYGEYNLSINTGAGDVDLNGDLANIGSLDITSTSAASEILGIISTDTIITKAGAGTLTLSAANTYTGDTTISAGTLKVTGTLADTTDVSVASGATYDVDQTDTIQSLSGAGTINIASTNTLTFGDANDKTIDGVIEGDGSIVKVGASTYTLSNTNTYTGDTTISAGTLKLTGNLNSATDLVIAPSATLDLQAALTAATLDLDGTISNTAGTSSLIISGTSSLGGSITTTGTQTYNNAVTLTGDTTLATSSAQVTFAANATINSEGSETNNLTITASETELNGVIGYTRTLGVIDINGNLDLNAAITNATSMDVSGTANLGADVTTTGTQAYQDAVTLSNDVTFTTTNSDVTFSSTVDSDAALTKRNLTLTLGSGAATFSGIVGGTALADITLNSSATFNAVVTADNLTIAVNKTVTVKDDATITSTIALSGSSTLAVNNASAITIAGNITDTGSGNIISVNDSDASAAPNQVTFSGTVAADSLTVGTTTTAGKALFTNSAAAVITNITITGGDHADEDSTATFNYALTATAVTLDDNTGIATIVFAEDNSVTIAGTIDGAATGEGNLLVSGQTKTFSGDVGVTNEVNFIIQASPVFNGSFESTNGTIDADFTAPNLSISGDITINANVTTTGTQTYSGAVTLSNNVILTTSDSDITFNGTIDSANSTRRNLTLDLNGADAESITAEVIFGDATTDTLGETQSLGAITITGGMDLNAAIVDATSLSISGTANLGADVTTTGTQAYQDAVTLSADVILTTTDSNITFTSTLRSDAAESARDLTVNLDANSDGTSADLILNGVVGGVSLPLDVISITGDLDLNASIGNSPGATSIIVSGDTNLGADVETTSTQTYQGAVTVSADITLTTTNSNIDFDAIVNADTAGRALTLAAGSGDVTFDNAIGGSTALGNLNITTGALTAGAIKAQGTITVNNSASSAITGIISDGATAAILTKTGAGTLSLSGTNTYTGQTNINTGTLAVTVNDALGSNAAGTVIASGATLDLQNVNYTTTEAITNNGGTLATSTGTSAYAGVMTLGADSTVDVDGTQLTISTAIGDGSGGYAITKDGNGTLVLSATSTYTGDTTISNGYVNRDRHLSRYYRCKCCIRSHLRCGSNRYHSITIRCRYH